MSIMRVMLMDITMLKCDCIVNAANKSLLGGGGVDGAIHRAAGPGLVKECATLGGCETGEAKITGGYNLNAKYVIHTVGPIYSGDIEDALALMNCYTNTLNLAKENGIRKIAFPSISTGVYGYPVEEAVPLAVGAVDRWIKSNQDYDIEVIFSCYDDYTLEYYRYELSKLEVENG